MTTRTLSFSGRSVQLAQAETPAAALRALDAATDAAAFACFSVTPIGRTVTDHKHWTRHLREQLVDAGWARTADEEGAPLPRGGSAAVPDAWWSASHSGAGGVFAVANGPVGVDIEYDRTLRAPENLWARIADQRERDAARAFFNDESLLGLWTAKEAVAKGRGEGILRDFRTLRWQPLEQDTSLISVTDDARGNRAEEWMLAHERGGGYWLSLAFQLAPSPT